MWRENLNGRSPLNPSTQSSGNTMEKEVERDDRKKRGWKTPGESGPQNPVSKAH